MSIRTTSSDDIDLVILPPVRDLGDGFSVRRALPSAHRRMVGPFIFFDQMGPAAFHDGEGLDVRPHPHIGLATVTYLLDGEIMHRDSVGSVQPIRPGEVNWMTAGSGIVHSERSDTPRTAGGTLFGLQTWLALPTAAEESAPDFAHYKADAIPVAEEAGTKVTLVAGTLDGLRSPVSTFSALVFADIRLALGARYQLRAEHVERAVYVVAGAVAIVGQAGAFATGELVVFRPGAEIILHAPQGARLMLIGGEPFPEERHIFWNFVSSRQDRIDQAKADWRANRFARVPEDVSSFRCRRSLNRYVIRSSLGPGTGAT